jgi:ABC-type iron transport system FetAB permease component
MGLILAALSVTGFALINTGLPVWELIPALFSGQLLTGAQVLQSASFVIGIVFIIVDFPFKGKAARYFK